MLLGEAHTGQHIVLGLVHDGGELGHARADLVGYGPGSGTFEALPTLPAWTPIHNSAQLHLVLVQTLKAVSWVGRWIGNHWKS